MTNNIGYSPINETYDMKETWDGINRRTSLRTSAERLVSSLSPDATRSRPVEVLLHELLVHKIELEMQNEELRKVLAALEDAHNHYLDFYEFSPIGYITITREGLISEINLTGSTLLGIERASILNCRFSKFLVPQARDHWENLFKDFIEDAGTKKQEVFMNMLRHDGSEFYAHLCYLRRQSSDAPPIVQIALTHIDKDSCRF